MNKRALKRAVWGSLSRLIGVGLGAGAGSLMYTLVGGGLNGWGMALSMSMISFGLMTFAEYEREIDE